MWRYLEEAVLRLNCTNRFTAEHFPFVLGQLLRNIEALMSSAKVSADCRRQMKMISLTAKSLLALKPWCHQWQCQRNVADRWRWSLIQCSFYLLQDLDVISDSVDRMSLTGENDGREFFFLEALILCHILIWVVMCGCIYSLCGINCFILWPVGSCKLF